MKLNEKMAREIIKNAVRRGIESGALNPYETEVYEAKGYLQALEQVAPLVEALEKIEGAIGCGCRPVCLCASETNLKIWKEEARSVAKEALAAYKATQGEK